MIMDLDILHLDIKSALRLPVLWNLFSDKFSLSLKVQKLRDTVGSVSSICCGVVECTPAQHTLPCLLLPRQDPVPATADCSCSVQHWYRGWDTAWARHTRSLLLPERRRGREQPRCTPGAAHSDPGPWQPTTPLPALPVNQRPWPYFHNQLYCSTLCECLDHSEVINVMQYSTMHSYVDTEEWRNGFGWRRALACLTETVQCIVHLKGLCHTCPHIIYQPLI